MELLYFLLIYLSEYINLLFVCVIANGPMILKFSGFTFSQMSKVPT